MKFQPFWMGMQTNEDREQIVEWLKAHGINPDITSEFVVAGDTVFCPQYATDEQGRTKMTIEGQPIFADSKSFSPTRFPRAVQEALDSGQGHEATA